jgi:hypothetical protein
MLTWLYRLELAWNARWSNVSLWARTYWVMVHNLTQGINTTGIYTRITTLLGKARLVSRTILVDDTLRIRAGSNSIDNTALAVHTARWWVARVDRRRWMTEVTWRIWAKIETHTVVWNVSASLYTTGHQGWMPVHLSYKCKGTAFTCMWDDLKL